MKRSRDPCCNRSVTSGAQRLAGLLMELAAQHGIPRSLRVSNAASMSHC